MKMPKGLQPLIADGMVDSVVRKLKSGKEASVYIVACGDQVRCAKVYKEAERAATLFSLALSGFVAAIAAHIRRICGKYWTMITAAFTRPRDNP